MKIRLSIQNKLTMHERVQNEFDAFSSWILIENTIGFLSGSWKYLNVLNSKYFDNRCIHVRSLILGQYPNCQKKSGKTQQVIIQADFLKKKSGKTLTRNLKKSMDVHFYLWNLVAYNHETFTPRRIHAFEIPRSPNSRVL